MITFKVWISHNALSEGVREVEAIPRGGGMIEEATTQQGRMYPRWYIGEGKQWHLTREGAITKANAMRISRIASLKKQLAKVEAMEFK